MNQIPAGRWTSIPAIMAAVSRMSGLTPIPGDPEFKRLQAAVYYHMKHHPNRHRALRCNSAPGGAESFRTGRSSKHPDAIERDRLLRVEIPEWDRSDGEYISVGVDDRYYWDAFS
jgi:hypothetical protein